MLTYTPNIHGDFSTYSQQLLRQRTRMLEEEILSFWRRHEPKKLDEYFRHGNVARLLKQQAENLRAVQQTIEEREQLPSSLAKMETWRSLMRIEEDEAEEASAWGMALDEYRSRSWATE